MATLFREPNKKSRERVSAAVACNQKAGGFVMTSMRAAGDQATNPVEVLSCAEAALPLDLSYPSIKKLRPSPVMLAQRATELDRLTTVA